MTFARRPVWALHVLVVGLALHNLVMSQLYRAGVRGAPLSAIAAWKDVLLVAVVALSHGVRDRRWGRGLRPGRRLPRTALVVAAVRRVVRRPTRARLPRTLRAARELRLQPGRGCRLPPADVDLPLAARVGISAA